MIYTIISSSGADLGQYEAESPGAALDSWAMGQGHGSYADALAAGVGQDLRASSGAKFQESEES